MLDGATGIRKFLLIDVPLVLSQIKLLVILVIIYGVQGFEALLILTQGKPGFRSDRFSAFARHSHSRKRSPARWWSRKRTAFGRLAARSSSATRLARRSRLRCSESTRS